MPSEGGAREHEIPRRLRGDVTPRLDVLGERTRCIREVGLALVQFIDHDDLLGAELGDPMLEPDEPLGQLGNVSGESEHGDTVSCGCDRNPCAVIVSRAIAVLKVDTP